MSFSSLPVRSQNIKKMKNAEKVLVLSDIHFPKHCITALSLAMQVAADWQPDWIVLLGDIWDCEELSKYPKKPEVQSHIQQTVDYTVSFLRELRRNYPNARITYFSGNHEERLERYLLSKAIELYNLDAMSLPSLLSLEELDIEYHSYGSKPLEHKGFLFEHGKAVSGSATYTAKKMFSKRLRSGIIGHTHRQGIYYQTGFDPGRYLWIENGHLCEKDPSYVYSQSPNWQQGFTCLTFFGNAGDLHVEQVAIEDNWCVFKGKHYSVD